MARPTLALVLAALLVGCGSKASAHGESSAVASAIAKEPVASATSSAAPACALIFARGERDLDMLIGGKLGAKTAIMHVPLPDGGVKETMLISSEFKVKDDNPEVRKTESEMSAEYGPDLALKKSLDVTHESGTEERVECTVTGDSLHVVVDKPSHHEDKTFKLPEDANNEVAVFEELRAKAASGTPLPLEKRFREFSDKDMEFTAHTMKLLERVRFDTPGGAVDAWKLEIKDEKDGTTTRATFDDGGLPLHVELETLLLVLHGTAPPSDGVAELDPELPVEGGFDHGARELHVDVVVKDDGTNPDGAIRESPYQHVTRSGDTYSLTLMPRKATPGREAPALPMTDVPSDVAKYLGPTADSQSDDPGIIAKAKEIAGSEKDSRRAAVAIVKWVSRTLKKSDGVRGAASAVETLKAGRGDCTEHAALVVALARALGIPARNSAGMVLIDQTPTRAGYHAWPELWLGEWVVLDAALGDLNVGPNYIWLGYDEPGEVNSPSLLRLVGRTKIVIKP